MVDLIKPKAKYIQEFAEHAIDLLKLNDHDGYIFIENFKELDSNCFGCCWGDSESAVINIANNQFGNKISREDKLKSLAHELVHAKQYLLGELREVSGDASKAYWRGELYNLPDSAGSPWEQEAYELEETIYESFICINKPK